MRVVMWHDLTWCRLVPMPPDLVSAYVGLMWKYLTIYLNFKFLEGRI
jgi:hypothetical protein